MTDISVFRVEPGKGDPPCTHYVQIWLSGFSQGPGGRILLSPDLMTDVEVDESVDLLIKQLEKIRKEAKKELHKKK